MRKKIKHDDREHVPNNIFQAGGTELSPNELKHLILANSFLLKEIYGSSRDAVHSLKYMNVMHNNVWLLAPLRTIRFVGFITNKKKTHEIQLNIEPFFAF